jgi:tetratricopeptide (TPR) repeat protein
MNEDDFEFLTELAISSKNRSAYEQFSERYDTVFFTKNTEYNSLKAQHYEAMGLYEEALKYWKHHIETGKAIDNVFYFERPFKVIYQKQHKPKEAIEFMEYAIEKYPKGKLAFNYYIAKVSAEKGIEKSKGEKSIDYCLKYYETNRRFTLEDVKKIKQKLTK